MWLFYLAGWALLLVAGLRFGAQYDYPAYMVQWKTVLAGENPWLVRSDNVYGLGHQLLAPLFRVHTLAPKILFILCWFLSFAVLYQVRRNAIAGLAMFLALFATPFFVVLVCDYGSEDMLVGFLTLLSVDLAVRKKRTVLPAIVLGVAVLTKLYPLALLPFLVTERRAIHWRFVLAFAATLAAGFLLTVALWGWSVLHIVTFAAARPGKMLSIFWFLQNSKFSPLVNSALAQTLIDDNFIVVAGAMGLLYGLHILSGARALGGTVLASLCLLAFYKVGNPQYFITPLLLLIYWLAQEEQAPRPGLLTAALFYGAVLNVFELWYAITDGSYQYPQARALIGLPCFIAGIALMWQIVRTERVRLTAGGEDHG